jgi:pyruvate formate lyase activating enzyme
MSADRSLTAPVFNIQSYCIHDGPGIRVSVFLKGCPLHCLWCQNPESLCSEPQLMFYGEKCTGCGRCAAVCPAEAISVVNGLSRTERALCAACGACAETCLSGARELAGKLMTVSEVLDEVIKERLFLDESGGGLTVTGGEALRHPAFSAALLEAAHEEKIRTAVESCCFATRERIDLVYRHVDYAMCDVKHMDSAVHKKLTGVPNELILANIRHICRELNIPTVIRVPTVPGCNADEANIRATAEFIRIELAGRAQLQLLPYHRMGEAKRQPLGLAAGFHTDPPSDELMLSLKAAAEESGVSVQIGGIKTTRKTRGLIRP